MSTKYIYTLSINFLSFLSVFNIHLFSSLSNAQFNDTLSLKYKTLNCFLSQKVMRLMNGVLKKIQIKTIKN